MYRRAHRFWRTTGAFILERPALEAATGNQIAIHDLARVEGRARRTVRHLDGFQHRPPGGLELPPRARRRQPARERIGLAVVALVAIERHHARAILRRQSSVYASVLDAIAHPGADLRNSGSR